MEHEGDFLVYENIRKEDRKGKASGDAAFESSKDSFSSNHVQRCVRALLNHEILKDAFDLLLQVPGLRYGMRFSTLHKLCCARSDEEAAAYLRHTFDSWLKISLGSLEAMKRIDAKDVQALELRCPKLCSRDATDIETMIDYGHIFTAFSQDERAILKNNILSIDYIIPSLRTFFQDMHLLQICAASMKHIVTPYQKMTIRSTLRQNYKLEILEQGLQAGQTLKGVETATGKGCSFELSMEKLWIFVLGEFQRMPPPNQGTGGRLLAGYLVEKPQKDVLFRFSRLAKLRGFHIPEINRLSQLLETESAYHDAPEAGSQAFVTSNSSHNLNLVSLFTSKCIKTPSNPLVAVSSDSYARVLRRRCGRPKHDLYQQDKAYLTREFIHSDTSILSVACQDIPTFFVLRSQCLSFFSSSRELLGNEGAREPAAAAINVANPLQISRIQDSTPTLTQIREVEEPSERNVPTRLPLSNTDNAMLPEEQSAPSPRTVPNLLSDNRTPPEHNHLSSIKFALYKKGIFNMSERVDASEVEDKAKEFMREKNLWLYDVNLGPTTPESCLESSRLENLNLIILLTEPEISQKLRDDTKEFKNNLITRGFKRTPDNTANQLLYKKWDTRETFAF